MASLNGTKLLIVEAFGNVYAVPVYINPGANPYSRYARSAETPQAPAGEKAAEPATEAGCPACEAAPEFKFEPAEPKRNNRELFGRVGEDRITGFAGYITAITEYEDGSAMYLLEKVDGGDSHQSVWLPSSRVNVRGT